MRSDCIFCKIVRKEVPANILFENDSTLAFLDSFPTTRGHSLVITREHYSHFPELTPAVACDLIKTVLLLAPSIVEALHADGFNLGLNNNKAAGQVIEHVHMHIIPRYANDALTAWKGGPVSPEELTSTAEQINRRVLR